MPQHKRAFVPDGTFFFTVTLLERRRQLLTERIDDLRTVFVAARQRRPFTIEAIVICLPGTQIFRRAGMISKQGSPPELPARRYFQKGAE
jgi:hypothetical protein